MIEINLLSSSEHLIGRTSRVWEYDTLNPDFNATFNWRA